MEQKIESNVTKLWLGPLILGGLPFIFLLDATLQKGIQFFRTDFQFPGLVETFEATGALIGIFFPLLFILTTVRAYSKTPVAYRPRAMFLIRGFLIVVAVLTFLNIEMTQWQFFSVIISIAILLFIRTRPKLKSIVGWLWLIAFVLQVLYILGRLWLT